MAEVTLYDQMKAAFGDAFDITDKVEEEVKGLSGKEYAEAVEAQKKEETKHERRIKKCWVGVIIYMVLYLLIYMLSLTSLSLEFIWTGSVYYVLVGVAPFILWGYSTKYDYFNFYNRKMRCFYIAMTNLAMCFSYMVYTVAAKALIPEFAKLPVSSMVSVQANMNLARLVLALFTAIPFACLMLAVFKQRRNEMFTNAVLGYKIVKEIDFREDTRFSYDMDIVKDLKTGVSQIIKEADRFLHSVANGTTGTGKTSSCFTCAIEGDLERRQANLEYLKHRIEDLLRRGKIRMKSPMKDDDFNLDNFEAIDGEMVEDEILFYEKYNVPEFVQRIIDLIRKRIGKKTFHSAEEELEHLRKDVKICGITAMAPNADFSQQVYELARKNGIKNVYRIDPTLGEDGKLKYGFIGFNPLYITPGLSTVDFIVEVSHKATLFADVCQAIFDSSGQQDPYFSSVNKNVTVTACMMVMLVYPYMPGNKGKQPTPADAQSLINDFTKFKPYREKFVQLYAAKDGDGAVKLINGRPDVGSYLQPLLDKVDNDFLGAGAEKLWRDAGGLRILIDTFMTNPLIRNVLCAKESLDIDKALERGDIVLVNYALELSSDGIALGLFFMLSYIQAVLRRPGTEDTRIPNFFYVDEFPVLLHPEEERCFSLFRQYRVAMFVAIQSLSQLDKNPATAYMKQVIMGNCAHHFVFGRVGTEEMRYYQELGGMGFKVTVQEGTKESSLKASNPSVMRDRREVVERDYNYYGSDIRYMDFQEVFVVSVVGGSPRAAFKGKVSFLPGSRRIAKAVYVVNWKPYYHGIWNLDDLEEDNYEADDYEELFYGKKKKSSLDSVKRDVGKDVLYNKMDEKKLELEEQVPVVSTLVTADIKEDITEPDVIENIPEENLMDDAMVSPDDVNEEDERELVGVAASSELDDGFDEDGGFYL